MAKGKKYGDDVREKAYALFASGNTVPYVAKKLGLPESTVRGWRKTKYTQIDEENLVAIRAKKKEEFVSKAWKAINLSQTLLERKLARAVEQEEEIDSLMKLVDGTAKEVGLSDAGKRALLNNVAQLRCDDLGKLATVLGTLYDKQALAMKEATEIVEGEIKLKKFEDF